MDDAHAVSHRSLTHKSLMLQINGEGFCRGVFWWAMIEGFAETQATIIGIFVPGVRVLFHLSCDPVQLYTPMLLQFQKKAEVSEKELVKQGIIAALV